MGHRSKINLDASRSEPKDTKRVSLSSFVLVKLWKQRKIAFNVVLHVFHAERKIRRLFGLPFHHNETASNSPPNTDHGASNRQKFLWTMFLGAKKHLIHEKIENIILFHPLSFSEKRKCLWIWINSFVEMEKREKEIFFNVSSFHTYKLYVLHNKTDMDSTLLIYVFFWNFHPLFPAFIPSWKKGETRLTKAP
jgi:hypothetical protein